MANRNDKLREAALDYHRYPTPGKLSVTATTTLANQRDLALAYSPGVAFACEEIVKNPDTAVDYTARGNLVGVISNGAAPAPDATRRTLLISLPVTRNPFRTAAATQMAVPC